jgi:CDP-glucose 4,6-dehydratase
VEFGGRSLANVRVKSNFWDGKRVLVTGHSGFKGGWISLYLHMMGARVFGVSLAPESDSLFNIAMLEKIFDDGRFTDILEAEALKEFIGLVEPEIVIHMAAQSLVSEGYRNPIGTFSTNAVGTVSIIESCLVASSATLLINVTTDKVYDNREWGWSYRESDSLGGNDPYSCSKACSELVSQMYRASERCRSHGLRIVNVRGGNVIGGGDFAANRLLPDIVRAFSRGDKLSIRSPDATRPWQYVLDCVRGYLMAAECVWNCGTSELDFNFGPSVSEVLTVQEVLNISIEYLSGYGIRLDYHTQYGKDEFKESRFLTIDNARATQELAWRPLLNCRESIRTTLDWYRSVSEGQDPFHVSKDHIKAYIERTS